MTKLVDFFSKMREKKMIMFVLRGIAMGLMLIALYIHLLNSDLTSAPEFIYNQF